jgi:hypothetical protein
MLLLFRMIWLVHIADERNLRAIRRLGLQISKARSAATETSRTIRGIFAVPLVPNFMLSHQWVREIKRRGFRYAVAVYFRLPDEEPVWAGPYGEGKSPMTAAQCASDLEEHQLAGFEVIIPRSIRCSEIRRIRPLPRVRGWRQGRDRRRTIKTLEPSRRARGRPPVPSRNQLWKGARPL